MGFFGGGGSPYYTSGNGAPGALNKPAGTLYTRKDALGLYISAPTLTLPSIAGAGAQFAHNAAHSVPGSFNLPGAPTVGNLILLFFYASNDIHADLNTAKWTMLDFGTGISQNGFVAYRYVQAGDTAALPAISSAANSVFWGATAVEITGVTGVIGTDIPYFKGIWNANAATSTTENHNATSASQLAIFASLQYNGTANVATPAGLTLVTSWNDGAANFGAQGLFTLAPASGANISTPFTRVAGSNSQGTFQLVVAPVSAPAWTQITIP